MFRIAICDDEKIFRDDLKEILIRCKRQTTRLG